MPRKKKQIDESHDLPPERVKVGKRILDQTAKEQKKQEDASIKLVTDVKEFIESKATETGRSPLDVATELSTYSLALIEFDETQGKASLVFNWSPTGVTAEKTPQSELRIAEYRALRENFAPVAAGIEWHKDFTSGGGFTLQTDDTNNAHQKESKDEIERLCRNVYQDALTSGLDSILDIMMDPTLTDGCAGAEVVYNIETNFTDYIKVDEKGKPVWEQVQLPDRNRRGAMKTVNVPIIVEPDWGKLGGITRIKIIDDAVNRLVPYRHPISGEILFWVLDEKANVAQHYRIASQEAMNEYTVKFHTWEIFWLSPNRRGTNLKGPSIIQAVYNVAKFVQAIQNAIGVGFSRWANKKYFFVCGDPRRPWSKIHINQFLKSMEKMISNNWVGIPVPPGFDIKEMGGEQAIFEGKSLLDYLTGMICAGMQYPREFLEVGKTQASDKAWLAWTVRYGRSQLQIRRAIEHQLFERHLWCKFGKFHRIPTKGVKPEEQPTENTYVPKIEWRAEGRWHRAEKIKADKSVLDAANPADAPLKMAIEKDLGIQLGLGNLDFSSYEKLYEHNIKTRIAEAETEKLMAQAKLKYLSELGVDKLAENIKKQEQLKLEAAEEKVEQAKQPPTQPDQAELERRAEARLEGGVSRTGREQPSKKGEAKPVGGTRQPKLAETQELSLLPKDIAEQIANAITETEKLKQEKAKTDLRKSQIELKRTEKKIKMMDELEERLNKKKGGDNQ